MSLDLFKSLWARSIVASQLLCIAECYSVTNSRFGFQLRHLNLPLDHGILSMGHVCAIMEIWDTFVPYVKIWDTFAPYMEV